MGKDYQRNQYRSSRIQAGFFRNPEGKNEMWRILTVPGRLLKGVQKRVLCGLYGNMVCPTG